MKRAMTMATMITVVGNKEGDGDDGKSNGNGDEGGWRAKSTRAITTRVARERR